MLRGSGLPWPDGYPGWRGCAVEKQKAGRVCTPKRDAGLLCAPHNKNSPQQNGTPLFAENSVFAQFHKDLQPIAQDTIITKETPSAFVGTDLDARLKKQGIKKVIVAGLMTHMCISSTARDAVPLGYSVIIPEDATATRDLDDGKGGVVDHDTLQRAALAGVADVFAEIMTTDQVMALAVEK
ncbi:cysteine hydrolase family protein [Enterobacter ludwigii]|uniref:cysteine hydrolase family protein n=1 Tax=Enterobacter ludwigii TaxID=299767 RepID=UPI003D9C49A6